FSTPRRPPSSPLFPYTTLFRSATSRWTPTARKTSWSSTGSSPSGIRGRRSRAGSVRDPVDEPRVVVGDEEGAVGQLLHIHRAAPGGAVGQEPALGKDLLPHRLASLVEADPLHPVADGFRPVPGAVLGDEGVMPVLVRE